MAACLPEPFDVRYIDGPDCPICLKTIILQCTVRIKNATVRRTGGSAFGSNMAVSLDAEVTEVKADHACKPEKS